MKTVSRRRKILFLLLVMVLATPWASVAQLEGPRSEQISEQISLSGRLWSFVGRMWRKAGCHIDPWGQCLPEPKEGCNIDPWGRCLTLIQPKEGCNIDPLGRCVP